MQSLGDWLDAASAATGQPGLCYRTAIFHDTQDITWLFPHSNTAELISAWLDLAEVLGVSRYQEMALCYADRILADPVRGLYRGECQEAHGLAWYWPDDGTYTGGYSMRFPYAFRSLYKLTGDQRYLDACIEIARTFLRRNLRSGLSSMVGWCPTRGWISGDSAGCRYGYVLATYANLFAITEESIYRDGYEQAVKALFQMQRDDGAFYQTYYLDTLEPADASIKLHFFSYLFNALSEAHAVFHDDRLIACARHMAEYLAGIFYYRQQLPYCEHPAFETDLAEADSAISDSSHGLFWLHSLTGDRVCLDMASKLWMQSWLSQWNHPGRPGWHGAVVRGVKPLSCLQDTPQTLSAKHLQYEPSRLARCEVWFATQHIQASTRLLSLLAK